MQTKLIAGAAAIAVTCLFGGAILSDQLVGSDHGQARAARDDSSHGSDGSTTRVPELSSELQALRTQLAQKDEVITELRARLDDLPAAEHDGEGDPSARASRAARWKEIQATLAPVMAILVKMQEKGANRFQLGPQMVAELGRVSSEKFDEIMAFDASETDPEVIAEIRAVMVQALVFVPGISKEREGYMERYLERAKDGGYGDRFTEQALRRISYSMPPFVDAYQKVVQPLNAKLRTKFVDMAIERAAPGAAEGLRMDGVHFLTRADDPRATIELTRVLALRTNSQALRLAALKGLSTRANNDVLRALENAAATDQDEAIRARAAQAVEQMEKQLAAQK